MAQAGILGMLDNRECNYSVEFQLDDGQLDGEMEGGRVSNPSFTANAANPVPISAAPYGLGSSST